MTRQVFFGILLAAAPVDVLLPRDAAAQAHYPPSVYSSSWACHGPCDLSSEYALSDQAFPGPVTTSISRHYPGTGYDFGGVAESTLVHGRHDAYAYAAGFTDVGQNWVNAKAEGQLFDTVVVTGGTGTAVFHLPIHVTGSVDVSWTVPELHGYPGASARYGITCAVGQPFSGIFIDCPDPEIVWEASAGVDQVIELVWSFEFGAQRNFDLRPSLSTEAGSAAGFSGGVVTGSAEAALSAVFLPAYVTGTTAEITVTSDSGFDYLTAPEPGAGPLAGVAMAVLGLLASRRAAGPGARPSSRSAATSARRVRMCASASAYPPSPKRWKRTRP
jgi:hypothetical protein